MFVKGKCHICVAEGRRELTQIDYCSICKHWFCEKCRGKWWDRGWEAVKEKFFRIKRDGCCGPVRAERSTYPTAGPY